MRIASYIAAGRPSFGVVTDHGIVDVPRRLPHYPDLVSVLAAGALAELAPLATEQPDHTVDAVDYLPTIPNPGKILCSGINYQTHRDESGLTERPEHPTLFVRFADSIVGHAHDVPHPGGRLDYEGEIAAIIGREVWKSTVADAADAVAAYAPFNDLSVRDWQRHSTQWTAGKNFLGVGSFGPWAITADEFTTPADLGIVTRVNGEVRQNATADDLIFTVPELVAYISTFTPLRPGDLIVTGTPGGVGNATDQLLTTGDTVEVEIPGHATLRNTIT